MAACSITVTSAPSPRAEAATSQPIQPAPTIASRPPPDAAALIASESATERSVSTVPPSAPSIGGRRGTAPVAISSRSYAIWLPLESVTRCAPGSSAVALVPRSSSTSRSP